MIAKSLPLAKYLRTTKKHLQLLKFLGIESVSDFLQYFPRTYSDQSEYRKINEIRTDDINVIKGTLSQIIELKSRQGKQILRAKFHDDTGSIDVIWFNQPFLRKLFHNGMQTILSGKAKFELGKITMISPNHEEISCNQIHTGRLVPIYHETEGLSSKWIREKLSPLLKYIPEFFYEYLPDFLIKEYDLMSYTEAIKQIHFPKDQLNLDQAKFRLAFDELFLLQLKALQKKWQWQNSDIKNPIQIPTKRDIGYFIKKLPFELTNDQKYVLNEILSDLNQKYPMSRLLQGDTGSGKTVVAAAAILNTMLCGYQTTLMAPTEILAKQHYTTIYKLFKNYNFNIKFVSGSTPAKEKKHIILDLKNGVIDLIIGTHALIQPDIQFKKLGLVIIDEQHRFGVEQRNLIKNQGNPHLLSLSATPIPRTLAMTVYGDQDLSIIAEMPKGRLPIITRIVPEQKRKEAYRWIEDRIQLKQQVFIICPLIDESDSLELKSVIHEYEYLQNEIFPHLKLTFIHGKLKSKEKEKIMNEFKMGNYDILVSTSVIEVGIDIPNASIIVIEGAERFGLAQLHQFRGRIGRGKHQSYCFLFMQHFSENAKHRLKAMTEHTSGFQLAEIDMELRGSGQIYGVKQSGIPDLKMASLSDSITIAKARQAAQKIITIDPELKNYSKLHFKLKELDEN